ncbi:hypothetical protein AGABI2DRAFT_187932 [Agaricus bisporus var. bisporus H97]|uniref:hypothetical protein n=1 Tax=Agaricus bisporus var. bisporus (strain H97 / ATCC MYA-4626 / FGSC 10389) TaxID=936046 RepID=UPI00029F7619|nr:hypothetical protein AGABI2DRAFT_187932 [Agaricus bisporus var. bisporus H97]EKV43528.1 hypothetical protein AGABI2DRAFT_187932 [Agaricus bisporus var. bisporus H97]
MHPPRQRPLNRASSSSDSAFDDGDPDDELLQLSSSDSSAGPSPTIPKLTLGPNGDFVDEISKELAELGQLRKSVQTNLRLRPIKSKGKLPKLDVQNVSSPHFPPTISSSTNAIPTGSNATSPTSSIRLLGHIIPHRSLQTPSWIERTVPSSTVPSSFSTSPGFAPKPTNHKPRPIPAAELYTRLMGGARGQPQPLVIDTRAPAAHVANRIRGSVNIAIPSLILKRCKKLTASGTNTDLNPSPNVPQTGGGKGGFQSLESLRQFVVGEKAKSEWSKMLWSLHRTDDGKGADTLTWDGDIVVCDAEMEQEAGGTAWILMDVLLALTRRHGGRVDYLEGGIMTGVKDTELEKLIDFGPMGSTVEEPSAAAGGRKFSAGGLFQLDTKKKPSDIEISSTLSSSSTSLSSNPTSPAPLSMPHSPINIIPPPLNSSSISKPTNDTLPKPLTSIPVHVIHEMDDELDFVPSPPPSSLIFRPCALPQIVPPTGGLRGKRPSVPNLRKIDTTSAEHLNPHPPKLSLRTKPIRSATLAVPPRLTLPGLHSPASPSHLNLAYSNHSPPASARYTGSFGIGEGGNFGTTPYYTPPHTPKAISSFHGGSMSAHPSLHGGHSSIFGYNSGADLNPGLQVGERFRDRDYPPSPSTARPEPPSTESEAVPVFAISTILPNFLFLGPELTEPSHVEELRELGVKRILNIALECNEDDFGLNLKEKFRYVKIPMRDTVEEENVQKGVRQACEMLAVMAYLIHANHWTLSRAYAFVLERRKGISPNIGFVSELMSFEEQELGGKSIGVQSNSMGGENGEGSNGTGEDASFGMNLRRGGHVRESLPPMESFSSSAVANNPGNVSLGGNNGVAGLGGPISAGGIQLQRVLVGDQAQEMEVKDASGRYRHARRAPVDENTLQPLRRVSKAGLESSAFEEVPRGGKERERE